MTIAEFKTQLKPYKALLGFDYGSKRLGVAVSDLLLMTATPYKIIQRGNFQADLAEIQKIIREKELNASCSTTVHIELMSVLVFT